MGICWDASFAIQVYHSRYTLTLEADQYGLAFSLLILQGSAALPLAKPFQYIRSKSVWVKPRVCVLQPYKTLKPRDPTCSTIHSLRVPKDVYMVSYAAPEILTQLPTAGHLDLNLLVQIKVPAEALAAAVAAIAAAGSAGRGQTAATAAAKAKALPTAQQGAAVGAPDWWEVQWVVAHECKATLRVTRQEGELLYMEGCLTRLSGWQEVCFQPVSPKLDTSMLYI